MGFKTNDYEILPEYSLMRLGKKYIATDKKRFVLPNCHLERLGELERGMSEGGDTSSEMKIFTVMGKEFGLPVQVCIPGYLYKFFEKNGIPSEDYLLNSIDYANLKEINLKSGKLSLYFDKNIIKSKVVLVPAANGYLEVWAKEYWDDIFFKKRERG